MRLDELPEAGIRAMLLAHPDVAALVGDRVAPYEIPPDPAGGTFPCITYLVPHDKPITHSEGLSRTREATLELTAWVRPSAAASGYATARALGLAIRAALSSRTYRSPDGRLWLQEITEEGTSTNPPDSDAELWSVDCSFTLIFSTHPPASEE